MSAVMHGQTHRGRTDNRALNYAVFGSLLFHALFLFLLSQTRESKGPPVVPVQIVARLVQPAAAPATTPEPQPEPSKPRAEEPPPPPPVAKPVPLAKPSPIPQPAPKPPAQAKSTSPAPAALAAPSTEPAQAPPALAVAPRVEPSTPSAPQTDADSPDRKLLTRQYGIQLKGQMVRYQAYPRAARDNNWEGKGELLLVIGVNGMIVELSVVRSTGHEILDKAMMENVRRAKPLVLVPQGLRGREFAIEIPFEWNLFDADLK